MNKSMRTFWETRHCVSIPILLKITQNKRKAHKKKLGIITHLIGYLCVWRHSLVLISVIFIY